jgi:predicted enzyme related to lactoylglutathione lyase
MSIDHVLAVIPVSDIPVADAWYERLLGRPATNRPMVSLVEWRVTETGWIQVFLDPERAGSALLNFAVDDLEKHVAELSGRGLAPSPVDTATKGVTLSSIIDPDGNRITFIGNFRPDY